MVFFIVGCASRPQTCPNLDDIQNALIHGRLNEIKSAQACGFDFHKEGDRALHIAAINKNIKIEKYLKSIGLKYNRNYIENLWFSHLFKVYSFNPLVGMYKIDKKKPLDKKIFKTELSSYMTSIGQDPNELLDKWGRTYIYKGSQPDRETGYSQHVFCTYGRDGEPGGTAYDQDICTDTTKQELNALLNEL